MSNSTTDIKILLAKYLDKKCTLDEKLQLYKLVASSDNENFSRNYYFHFLMNIKVIMMSNILLISIGTMSNYFRNKIQGSKRNRKRLLQRKIK